MGKNARVDGRRLAYDQMKAECRQGLLLANLGLGRTTRQCISEDDIVSFKTAIDKRLTRLTRLRRPAACPRRQLVRPSASFPRATESPKHPPTRGRPPRSAAQAT